MNLSLQRLAIHVIRLLMLTVTLLMLGFFVLIWSPAWLTLIWAAGRSDGCTLSETLASERNWHDLEARARRIYQECRLVRTDGPFQLWDTPQGPFWSQGALDPFGAGVLAELEVNTYGAGPIGVQPGDVVLDCGAEVGTFTRQAISRGARKVVAIDPEPHNAPCLRRNFAKEIDEGRVIVYPKGVWDRDDTLTLHVDTVVLQHAGPGYVINLTTIDHLVSELNLPRVDFIKMDIEGAEKNALRGARSTLQRFKPRLAIALEHLEDDPVKIPQTVLEMVSSYKSTRGYSRPWGVFRVRPSVIFMSAR